MPTLAQKPHRWRREWVIARKFKLRGEDATFVGCAFRTLDQGFPEEEIVFGDGAGGNAVGWVLGEGFVFVEEAAGGECGGGGHFVSRFF